MTMEELGIENDMPRGWVSGKGQPKWHLVLYNMWYDMHNRVKNPKSKNYEYYKDCIIHESLNTLSGYEALAKSQSNFQEFCDTCDEVSWSLIKI